MRSSHLSMVDTLLKPNSSAPSLHLHYKGFNTTMGWSESCRCIGTLHSCGYPAFVLLPFHHRQASHVPYKSPIRDHAASTPDVAQPVCTFLLHLSQSSRPHPGFDIIIFAFDACQAVHLRSSSLLLPSLTLTTMSSRTQQLKAVWYQPVQADTEGPFPSSFVKPRGTRTVSNIILLIIIFRNYSGTGWKWRKLRNLGTW